MKKLLSLFFAAVLAVPVYAQQLEIDIEKRYLNIPVSHSVDRHTMTISAPGAESRTFRIGSRPGSRITGSSATCRPIAGRR